MSADLEGCLSLPGVYRSDGRCDRQWPGPQFGERIRIAGTGTLGRCLQHETDHLNGVAMEDHLTAAERQELRRQHKSVAANYPDDWPA